MTPENQKKLKKLQVYFKDKDFASFEVQMELTLALQELVKNMGIATKIELKGDKGDTPIKGIDYFTDSEIKQIASELLKKATPIKGIHYKDGSDGKDGEDGESIRGPMGPEGDKGDKGDSGDDGKDAIIDEDEIVKKILAKIPEPLSAMPPLPSPHIMIKSSGTRVAEGIREINFTGATVTRVSGDQVQVAVGAGLNPQTPVGDINGSNDTFTITGTINALFLNGVFQTPGGVDYTDNGDGTITYVIPPPTGSNHYAL